jgi:hypothetical protein
MKRFWIILLAVAMALVIALPAGAGKPELSCDKHPNNPECTSDSEPPTDPPVLECAFDDNGVLTDSESGLPIELDRANSGIRCQLAADPSDSFKFVISGNASVVSFPYIAVTDVYPYGGDICFRDYVSGQVVNPENEENHVFGTFATEGSLDTFVGRGAPAAHWTSSISTGQRSSSARAMRSRVVSSPTSDFTTSMNRSISDRASASA